MSSCISGSRSTIPTRPSSGSNTPPAPTPGDGHDGSSMKADTATVGVVGLGTASAQVLPFFGKLPEIRLGGAADIRPEAREQFTRTYGAPAFDSVEAICRSEAIDAVWIATPNEFHAEHTILAARHGKHE